MQLKATPLFNENGGDRYEDQEIINGNPTGIANLNNVRYSWVNPLYRTMVGNFWVPQKVSLVEDRITLSELDEQEEEAVRKTLSFLIFLDSFKLITYLTWQNLLLVRGLRTSLRYRLFKK